MVRYIIGSGVLVRFGSLFLSITYFLNTFVMRAFLCITLLSCKEN